MGFPVWSAAVNAQGTVKATAGSVNVPVIVGGTLVRPGDVMVADDDGVLCVPRLHVESALEAAEARVLKEAESRAAYLAGELSLDRNRLRGVLEDLGVRYLTSAEYEAGHDLG
jgi:4-hydroxy-4-methyl-2-oxoglutarate aldolase